MNRCSRYPNKWQPWQGIKSFTGWICGGGVTPAPDPDPDPELPIASFEFCNSDLEGSLEDCNPDIGGMAEIGFINTSTGGQSYTWDFDVGEPDGKEHDENPANIYFPGAGGGMTVYITLTVFAGPNQTGVSDTITKPIVFPGW